MAMKLSTGKVAFPIEFDNGDRDVIYFNPNDREFIKRVTSFENSINERIKQINIEKYKAKIEDGINIDISNVQDIENFTPEEMESLKNKIGAVVDIDAEYQKALKDELNDIFKSDISSVVFKYCEPLDMVVIQDENGEEKSEIFMLLFLNAFAEEIKKHQNKVAPAMEKHLKKYTK
jgi:hypothetical protein